MSVMHEVGKLAMCAAGYCVGLMPALVLASSIELAASLMPGSALAQTEIKRGGTLVSAIPDNPPDLMNGVGTNILTGAIGGQIFDTLVRGDRDMKILPSLAKSWDVSPDGLSVTFHLQDDVTWHDGRPFTSEDVRYSFLEINRKYNSIASGAFAAITRIDTPDPLTVVIHIASPDPSFFPWSFAQPSGQVFPKHIYEGSDPRRNPMNFKPIGTGTIHVQGMGARQPHRSRTQSELFPARIRSTSIVSSSRSFRMRARARLRWNAAMSTTFPISRSRRRRSSRCRNTSPSRSSTPCGLRSARSSCSSICAMRR